VEEARQHPAVSEKWLLVYLVMGSILVSSLGNWQRRALIQGTAKAILVRSGILVFAIGAIFLAFLW